MAGICDLDRDDLGTLYVDGLEMPFADFGPVEPVLRLRLDGVDYRFKRSYPRPGFGAVMGKDARELMDAEGKRLLVARFGERLYLYVG